MYFNLTPDYTTSLTASVVSPIEVILLICLSALQIKASNFVLFVLISKPISFCAIPNSLYEYISVASDKNRELIVMSSA
jgi:hypothetical protein